MLEPIPVVCKTSGGGHPRQAGSKRSDSVSYIN